MLSHTPILNRPIRFAVVGCGRIARNHFGALKQHSADTELIAVCDADRPARDEAVASTGAKGYSNLEDLLASETPDVIVLCTPSGLHSQQAIKAARCGLHVVTEKPMATRWVDGVEMVRACDEAGVRLFVVKQNRRNATLQLLKRAMEQNRFGRVFMVTINVFWSRPQEYYNSARWRGTWEFDGGALMNQPAITSISSTGSSGRWRAFRLISPRSRATSKSRIPRQWACVGARERWDRSM